MQTIWICVLVQTVKSGIGCRNKTILVLNRAYFMGKVAYI